MKTVNTADIGFEDKIWKAADKMRGNIDASEYKSVVLGLIFLKYISDRFDAKYRQLVDEGEGFEEDKDEYLAENIFYVPTDARWSAIAEKAHTPDVGVAIDNAMRAIEKENKRLKDILPKNFGRPELDKRRLGDVVDLFTNIRMHDHGEEKDILGRTYEYCLSKFAEAEGKLAGEFYTPACIVKTLVNVLQPYGGRVYDPCCGSGGMFVQSAKFIENHAGNINNISVYGQDSNPTTWKMAQMNLAIRGIEADLGQYNADTFFNDCHPTLKADYVMANPPFNLSDWGADKLADDVRWKYGIPPNGNANFAWIQHIIHHLAPSGRAGVVLANGSLSSQSGGEGEIRRRLVEADLVDCIVAMPPQLFYTTQIPVSIWFFSKTKKQKGKTLFIDARNLGTMVTRKLRELTDCDAADESQRGDIQRIADTYNAFVAGTLADEKGFCAVASIDDIAAQDFILTPGRYVGIAVQEQDSEPFDEKMRRLTDELSDLFRQSHELEAEIKKQLESIGYKL
ncbi:MAG: type I restriction-modification system subunit M [Bacteroidaceae bacterium]|nr:type I restriction-modification system subunit M [Bacteroidaceae bacterium]